MVIGQLGLPGSGHLETQEFRDQTARIVAQIPALEGKVCATGSDTERYLQIQDESIDAVTTIAQTIMAEVSFPEKMSVRWKFDILLIPDHVV